MKSKACIFLSLLLFVSHGRFATAESSNNPSASENILGVKVLSINRAHNFLVIDRGAEDGIREGTKLNLLKDGKNIATLQIIRAKEKVSACDIKRIEPNAVLKDGDIYSVTISSVVAGIHPKTVPQKKEEKKEVVSKKKKPALPFITALPMMIHIDSRKEIVNYYLNETLRDMNFIITSSNTKEGLFTAHKFLPLPLWDEIWADLKGTADHRAIYDINTIDDETGTTLKLDIRLIYTTRAGKTKERSVWQGSKAVEDAVELVKRVKSVSEMITKER